MTAHAPLQHLPMDIHYLNDIPHYFAQMQTLRLPGFQHTLREECTGAMFVIHATELSKACAAFTTYQHIFNPKIGPSPLSALTRGRNNVKPSVNAACPGARSPTKAPPARPSAGRATTSPEGGGGGGDGPAVGRFWAEAKAKATPKNNQPPKTRTGARRCMGDTENEGRAGWLAGRFVLASREAGDLLHGAVVPRLHPDPRPGRTARPGRPDADGGAA